MKISPEILAALRQACEFAGNAAELSRRTGVSKSNLSRYLAAKTDRISDDNWEKLMPFLHVGSSPGGIVPPSRHDTIGNTVELRERIKDAMMAHGMTSAEDLRRALNYDSRNTLEKLLGGKLNWFPDMLSAVFDVLEIDQDEAPLSAAERMLLAPAGIYRDGAMLIRPVPVVDWANAAGFLHGMVDGGGAVLQKWNPDQTEVVPAPIGMRKGVVALRVSGESMEPKILDGDVLYCLPTERLAEVPSGKIVVVKFAETYAACPDCVVCKRLRRFGAICCLVCDNPAGRSFDAVEAADIVWAGTVIGKYCDSLD